jgi:hypothetical protein
MTEPARILKAIERGGPQAAEQLLPLVYDELRRLAARKLAHERPGQTLQAAALADEAFLRLAGGFRADSGTARGTSSPPRLRRSRACWPTSSRATRMTDGPAMPVPRSSCMTVTGESMACSLSISTATMELVSAPAARWAGLGPTPS